MVKRALLVIVTGIAVGATLGYALARWYPFSGLGRHGHLGGKEK